MYELKKPILAQEEPLRVMQVSLTSLICLCATGIAYFILELSLQPEFWIEKHFILDQSKATATSFHPRVA